MSLIRGAYAHTWLTHQIICEVNTTKIESQRGFAGQRRPAASPLEPPSSLYVGHQLARAPPRPFTLFAAEQLSRSARNWRWWEERILTEFFLPHAVASSMLQKREPAVLMPQKMFSSRRSSAQWISVSRLFPSDGFSVGAARVRVRYHTHLCTTAGQCRSVCVATERNVVLKPNVSEALPRNEPASASSLVLSSASES